MARGQATHHVCGREDEPTTFHGSAGKSKWERGWPFGRLVVSNESLCVKGFLLKDEVPRRDVFKIEVERLRVPFFWKTVLTLHMRRREGHGQYVFTPYRRERLLAALHNQGWSVTEV